MRETEKSRSVRKRTLSPVSVALLPRRGRANWTWIKTLGDVVDAHASGAWRPFLDQSKIEARGVVVTSAFVTYLTQRLSLRQLVPAQARGLGSVCRAARCRMEMASGNARRPDFAARTPA